MKELLPFLLTMFLVFSCDEPLDPIIESANNTTELVQRHVWHLEEITIKVPDKDIPSATLFVETVSLIRSGIYI